MCQSQCHNEVGGFNKINFNAFIQLLSDLQSCNYLTNKFIGIKKFYGTVAKRRT